MIIKLKPKASCPCSADACAPAATSSLLPIAPRATHKMRFAAPGKPAPALLPNEALARLKQLLDKETKIAGVELSGPGDPLATPGPTLETLDLLREHYPRIPVSIATLGLGGVQFAADLAAKGVTRLFINVDAVDPAIAQKIYAWIRPATRTIPLPEAVELLISEQAATLKACQEANLPVTVRTTVYPGYNDNHIEQIAEQSVALGVENMTLIPFTPHEDVKNSPDAPETQLLKTLKEKCKNFLPVTVGAVSLASGDHAGTSHSAGTMSLPSPTKERPNVAVVSSTGMDIDLHLGQAIKIMVYGPRADDGLPSLIATRPAPEPGGGTSRWESLAAVLPDCFALLTSGAGDNPRQVLAGHGISVLLTEGEIEGTVDVLYGGGKKVKKRGAST